MDVIVFILKVYFVFTIIVMIVYSIRHFLFAYKRMFGRQRLYYTDIVTTDLPRVTVMVPMHNEEQVLSYALDALLECRYDRDKIEIIPINDHSTDATAKMLDEYHARYPFIRPLHRTGDEQRGKPSGLNDALKLATGDVIIVFDADYRPAKDMIMQLALAFQDPEAGAVMGRVIPYNANANLLTRLLNLERSGGYQADQQARYNLRTVPQYGGTVGGFRKDLLQDGFDTAVLAEDTDLTYRLHARGYKVIYANSAECYEEVPEDWRVRARQVRRWSRGHNRVMFKRTLSTIFNRRMTLRERFDGVLLLGVYAVPAVLAVGMLDTLLLFFLGEMELLSIWIVLVFIGAYNSFGNFAPFYEIAAALMMDGGKQDVKLMPLISFNFYFYTWNITLGFFDNLADIITRRQARWDKTVRFAGRSQGKTDSPAADAAVGAKDASGEGNGAIPSETTPVSSTGAGYAQGGKA